MAKLKDNPNYAFLEKFKCKNLKNTNCVNCNAILGNFEYKPNRKFLNISRACGTTCSRLFMSKRIDEMDFSWDYFDTIKDVVLTDDELLELATEFQSNLIVAYFIKKHTFYKHVKHLQISHITKYLKEHKFTTKHCRQCNNVLIKYDNSGKLQICCSNNCHTQWLKEYNTINCTTKYGTSITNVFQVEEVKEKIRNTNMERYGHSNASQNSNVKYKSVQTCINKYGVSYPGQIPEVRIVSATTKKTNNSNRYTQEYKDNNITIFNPEKYIEENSQSLLQMQCNICNSKFDRAIFSGANKLKVYCPICNVTTAEQKIVTLLNGHNITFTIHNRNIIAPNELDIVISNKNLAIEVNGNYWHSDTNKHKDYHKNKMLEANSKNYELLSFFEDEVLNNFEFVKTLLLTKLELLPKERLNTNVEYIHDLRYGYLPDISNIEIIEKLPIDYYILNKNNYIQRFDKDKCNHLDDNLKIKIWDCGKIKYKLL